MCVSVARRLKTIFVFSSIYLKLLVHEQAKSSKSDAHIPNEMTLCRCTWERLLNVDCMVGRCLHLKQNVFEKFENQFKYYQQIISTDILDVVFVVVVDVVWPVPSDPIEHVANNSMRTHIVHES